MVAYLPSTRSLAAKLVDVFPGNRARGLPSHQAIVAVFDASTGTPHGRWAVLSDSTAVGGRVMRHPDAGAAKRTTALASPADYFELTFQAQANTAKGCGR